MPSTKDPDQIEVGAGKLHANVATAAADFATSSGTASLLATLTAALAQEVPYITRTTPVVGTGQTSIVISGASEPIWMGDGTISVEYEDYFRLVTDPYQDVPTEADGSPVYIASLVGAALGDGWFTGNLTINFSGPITGGFWTVYYGTRATLQSIGTPLEPFTYTSIRNTAHVQQNLANVLRDLHAGSGNRDWDDAWLSTIEDLAKSGLNERYRLSTTGSSTGTVDTAGAGALIDRDGQAPTAQATAENHFFYPDTPPDPYSAHWRTTAGPEASDTLDRENWDGGTGFVNVQQQRLTIATTMRMNAASYSMASRIDAIERYFSASTIGTANVRTKINPTSSSGCSLNPDAGSGFDDRREIELASSDYFWESGSGNQTSEVAVGRDLIEITYPSGDKHICVIESLNALNSRRAHLLNLTGGSPLFPDSATVTGVFFRFIKLRYWQSPGNQRFIFHKHGFVGGAIALGHFYHAITPYISDDLTQSGETDDVGDAEFFARARTPGDSGVTGAATKPYALRWGGYNPETWEQEIAGGLRGDGAVEATLFSQQEYKVTVTVSGSTVIDWHPSLHGSVLVVDLQHASGVAALTINIDVADYITNQRRPGDMIEIYIMNPSAAPVPGAAAPSGATYTISWGGAFSFESGTNPGGKPIIYNHSGRRTINKWTGTYSSLESDFIMRDEMHYIGAGD